MAKKKIKTEQELEVEAEVGRLLAGDLHEAFRLEPTEVWVIKIDGMQAQMYNHKEFYLNARDAGVGLLNYIKFVHKFQVAYHKYKGGIPVGRRDHTKWAKQVRQLLLDSGRATIERIR